MKWKNTTDQYGFIAKTLHWLTAILFLGSYISVYYRHWFTEAKTPENWTALQLHLSFGVSIGVIVVLRLIWRIMNEYPKEEPGTVIEHQAARWGHRLLYLMMIVMPITGYIGTGVATDYFFVFEIPKFQDTYMYPLLVEHMLGIDFETFEEPIDFFHKDIMGAWLVWILIAGHIVAALYHHFVKKDRTLKKMTFDSDTTR